MNCYKVNILVNQGINQLATAGHHDKLGSSQGALVQRELTMVNNCVTTEKKTQKTDRQLIIDIRALRLHGMH